MSNTKISSTDINSTLYSLCQSIRINNNTIDAYLGHLPYKYKVTDKGSITIIYNKHAALSLTHFSYNGTFRTKFTYNYNGKKESFDAGVFLECNLPWLSIIVEMYGRIVREIDGTIDAVERGYSKLKKLPERFRRNISIEYESPKTVRLHKKLFNSRALTMSTSPDADFIDSIEDFKKVFSELSSIEFQINKKKKPIEEFFDQVGAKNFNLYVNYNLNLVGHTPRPTGISEERYPDGLVLAPINKGKFHKRFYSRYTSSYGVKMLIEKIRAIGYNVDFSKEPSGDSVVCVQLTQDLFLGIYSGYKNYAIYPGKWDNGTFRANVPLSYWNFLYKEERLTRDDVEYILKLISRNLTYTEIDGFKNDKDIDAMLKLALTREIPKGVYITGDKNPALVFRPSDPASSHALVYNFGENFSTYYPLAIDNADSLKNFVDIFASNPDFYLWVESPSANNSKDIKINDIFISVTRNLFKKTSYSAKEVSANLEQSGYSFALTEGKNAIIRVSPEATAQLEYNRHTRRYRVVFTYTFDGVESENEFLGSDFGLDVDSLKNIKPLLDYLAELSAGITAHFEQIQKNVKAGKMVKDLVRPLLRVFKCPNTKIDFIENSNGQMRVRKMLPSGINLVTEIDITNYELYAEHFAEIFNKICEINFKDRDGKKISFEEFVKRFVRRMSYFVSRDNPNSPDVIKFKYRNYEGLVIWAYNADKFLGLRILANLDTDIIKFNIEPLREYLELLNKYPEIGLGFTNFDFCNFGSSRN